MKAFFTTLGLLVAFVCYSQGIGRWDTLPNFSGNSNAHSSSASIGNKLYLAYSNSGNTYYNDIWEWDKPTGIWTKKTDCPSPIRQNGVLFTIDGKLYTGLGRHESSSTQQTYADFHMFDPVANSWIAKASIPVAGASLSKHLSFSIGNKGYVLTGLRELWQYDSSLDSWSLISTYPGSGYSYGATFVIGTKGYIATSSSNSFYEWDQATNAWTRKADLINTLSGTTLGGTTGVTINGKGFLTGSIGLIQYNPNLDTWSYCAKSPADVIGKIDSTAYGLNWTKFYKFDPYTCPNVLPFTSSLDTITKNGTINFSSPYSSATSYNWKVNGVNFNNAQNCSYQFKVTGNFIISLEVTNGICKETHSKTIVVLDDNKGGWRKRANCLGSNLSNLPVAFSIGNKAYVATSTTSDEFWEWDQITDTWTKKADFPGARRFGAIGFSINGKGYVGTGKNATTKFKDMWEYDPNTNQWTQKSDFGGGGIYDSKVTIVNGKAYVSLGFDSTNVFSKKLWEYNPANDTWLRKTDYPGSSTSSTNTAFSSASNAYFLVASWLHEYNPLNDTWTQKKSNGSIITQSVCGFSSPNFGYVYNSLYNTFFKYIPATDQWETLAPGPSGKNISFSIGSSMYLTAGSNGRELWEYKANQCGVVANFSIEPSPMLSKEYYKIGAGILIEFDGVNSTNALETHKWLVNGQTAQPSSKLYYTFNIPGNYPVSLIASTGTCKDTLTRNVSIDCPGDFTKGADFTGTTRYGATAFSIGNKGYYGTGANYGGAQVALKDFWEWDETTNIWTKKADLPGKVRHGAIGFSINGKGYIALGDSTLNSWNPYLLKDLWEYDPAVNQWTRKSDFPGTARSYATCFVIGNKVYVGTGKSKILGMETVTKDFWEYDPAQDKWTAIADLPNTPRFHASSFSLNNFGYVGDGSSSPSGGAIFDFYQYNPATNVWIKKSDIPEESASGIAFSANGKGYLGFGDNHLYHEYDPTLNLWAPKKLSPDNMPTHGADGYVTSFAINGNLYIPYPLTQTHSSKAVYKFDPNGCQPVVGSPIGTIYANPTNYCKGDSVLISSNNPDNNLTYQWRLNGNNIIGANNYFYYAKQSGNYTLYTINSNNYSLITPPIAIAIFDTVATINPAGNLNINLGDSVVLNTSNNSASTYQWLCDGVIIPGATQSSYTAKGTGNYSVIVTNYCGSLTSNTVSVTVSITTSLIEESDLSLFSISPNPFVETTKLYLHLNKISNVKIYLYNINGQLVNVIDNKTYSAGEHIVDIKANTTEGILFINLIVDDKSFTKKLVSIK